MKPVKITDVVYIDQGYGIAQFRFHGGVYPVILNRIAQKLSKGSDGFCQSSLAALGGISGKDIESIVDKMGIDLILEGP